MKKQLFQSFIFLLALSVFVANTITKQVSFENKNSKEIASQSSEKSKSETSYKKMTIEATINLAQSQIACIHIINNFKIINTDAIKSFFKYHFFYTNNFLKILFTRLIPANAP